MEIFFYNFDQIVIIEKRKEVFKLTLLERSKLWLTLSPT